MAGGSDPVSAIVRSSDPDRYLAALYAPPGARAALLALAAFEIETGRVRDLVSGPMTGEIRLQWWRDAIAEGQGAGHPVAEALNAAIARHRLPVAAFERMLEARIFDLYDDPMPDRTTLEGYCGETEAAIFQLSAMVLDPLHAAAHAGAAGHAGCARAILRLLVMLARHRARGRCFVPAEILAAAGTDRDGFVSGRDADSVRRAAAAMEALAREHLAAFESAARGLPAALRPAFLPAATVGPWLDRIAWARGDGAAGPSPLMRYWCIFRRALRGW